MIERLGRRRVIVAALVLIALLVVHQIGSESYNINHHIHWHTDNPISRAIYSELSPEPYVHASPNSPQHILSADDEYRQRLRTVRPSDLQKHSRSLGVADGIYVISLARRKDRRATMNKIARALDLDFNFVDATDFKTPAGAAMIQRLTDRVRWQRSRIDEREAKESDWPKMDNTSDDLFVWNAFPFEWSQDTKLYADDPLAEPVGIGGADYWDMEPRNEEWEKTHEMPKLTAEDREKDVVHSASVSNHMLKQEPLGKAMVSCWHSHIKAFRQIIKKQHRAAIIFEDDIDIEWDAQSLLKRQWPSLPADWDIVWLGHCFSEEYRGDMVPGGAMLRKSFHTLCTHAYAVSQKGAAKIYRYLRSPDYAYGKPIDHGLKDLYQMGLIKSFSVYPPLVVQTKNDVSDIVGGIETEWKLKEALVDSTLERVGLLHNKTISVFIK